MEKDKAAKRAKQEREKALGAAGKAAGTAGKASNGRQDAPWLHPGITVKVHSGFEWHRDCKLSRVALGMTVLRQPGTYVG